MTRNFMVIKTYSSPERPELRSVIKAKRRRTGRALYRVFHPISDYKVKYGQWVKKACRLRVMGIAAGCFGQTDQHCGVVKTSYFKEFGVVTAGREVFMAPLIVG